MAAELLFTPGETVLFATPPAVEILVEVDVVEEEEEEVEAGEALGINGLLGRTELLADGPRNDGGRFGLGN